MGQRGFFTVVVVVAVAYGWWDAGVRPFTWQSYVLIAFPIAVVIGCYISDGSFARTTRRELLSTQDGSAFGSRQSAWWAIIVFAVLLEAWGLALGGRSSAVPTLSTTLDHLLATRVERTIVFVVWLACGASPLLQSRRPRVERGS